jgi:hypothetical protein
METHRFDFCEVGIARFNESYLPHNISVVVSAMNLLVT